MIVGSRVGFKAIRPIFLIGPRATPTNQGKFTLSIEDACV